MKFLKFSMVGLVVLATGAGLAWYWRYSTLYPSTQDAYVQAHVVTIASEVTGKVSAVYVAENQLVEAGDPLFEIASDDFDSAVRQANMQVDVARQSIDNYQQQIQAATVAVDSAKTANGGAQAQLVRVQRLFDDGNLAQAALDQAKGDAAKTTSELRSAEAALTQARTEAIANQDNLQSAQAAANMAQRNVERTKVTAPVDGWVANISLREGTVVTAYNPLFSMVDNSEWWVEANFKETDLARISVGQPVSFAVDMMPGTSLTGRVASIGRGSGSTFALLPAENASGNWVKVTQRFTARIAIDDTHPDLRVGASADVKVDTTGVDQ